MKDLTKSFSDELVELAKAGDTRAQSALWNRSMPIAVGTCRRYTHDSEELDWVVSNGLAKAFMNLHKWGENGPFNAWLSQVVRNETLDYLRTKSTQLSRRADVLDYNLPGDQEVSDSLEESILRNMIDSLPPKQKQVFQLVAYDGMNYREIEKHLGIKHDSVKSNVHDVRSKLKKQCINLGLR